jgi:ABC-type multidrug transport system fused ATPase/permease subunit
MDVGENRKFRLMRCLSVISRQDQRKLWAVSILQILVNFLDLFGVAIVGILGALAITGIRSQQPSARVEEFLITVRLDDLEFQQQMAVLSVIVLILLISRTLLSIYFSKRTLRFLANRGARISGELIGKLLNRPLLEIQHKSSQENLYAVTTGVSIITVGIIGSLVMILADFSLLILMFFGLLAVDPLVALSMIVIFGFIGGGLYKFMHLKAASIGASEMDLSIKGNSSILDALHSYRELLVKNQINRVAQKIQSQRISLAKLSADLQFLPILSKYIIELTVVFVAVMISAVQFLIQDSTDAIATLAVFLAAGSRIAPAVLRLQQNSLQIRYGLSAADSTLEELERFKGINLEKFEVTLPNLEYPGFEPSIKIFNVSFSYPGSDKLTLNNINLEIDQGDFVAIVGTSGAGKSTLVDLILGVIEPDSGSVEISGLTPAHAFKKWPGAVGYVPQDVYLIEGTLKDNLTFGIEAMKSDESKYVDALKKAKLDLLFDSPNLGLKTAVGEMGTKLSGGQRQRLGVARALISQPRLFVADEATSALDSETESDLMGSLQSLNGTATIVMVAHRLSSVRHANKVVFLSEGIIEAVGSFDEVRRKIPDFDRQARLMGL